MATRRAAKKTPPKRTTGRPRKPTKKAAAEAAAVNVQRRVQFEGSAPAEGPLPPEETPVQQPPLVEPTPSTPIIVRTREITPLVRAPLPPLPPPPSSPPPVLDYKMDITYLLRVNGKRDLEEWDSQQRVFFSIMDVEDRVEGVLANLGSAIEGRDYIWQGRSVQFRGDAPRSTWGGLTLADFSFAEGDRLLEAIDAYVRRSKSEVSSVEVKIELRVKVEATQKLFPRGRAPNEMTLDPLENTHTLYRTKQLIREEKAANRVKEILLKADHESALHQAWECRVEHCNNFKLWCFPHAGAHYAIKPVDVESWVHSIVEGKSPVMVPDYRVVESLRVRGD